ncbi:unnamed protein product [Fraxinus pennsylvanica]|uniref:Micro-fibrillar-associated protein 1 C-terminal domain-containing protein n=1 Tax=Fraxinus pennsylvanica TaxID=56036 RepID=A0AAD2DUV2_9LAMI|nr:unnamed protein product [Fraxinus pennsylvanica]
MERVAAIETALPSHVETYFMRKDDARLRRLAESRVDNREEVREDHRRIRQAEIVLTIQDKRRREDGVDLEDEDAFQERRRRIRERLLQRQQEEAALHLRKLRKRRSLKRERLEAEQISLEEAVKMRMEERTVETKQIVVDKIQEDQEIQRNMESEANIADVDTDDDVYEAEEYEDWKAREIARIKRDRDEREARLTEKEEIERVRNMTEEERREWERKNPKPSRKSKPKWRFMQKYYHKGAFFQSYPDDHAGTAKADNIYARDFSAPTGEDKMDKAILPKVMQVKHFGRSGSTKWTHLYEEDTTDWNNPWTYNDVLLAKYNVKMAGMSAPIAKPKGSKKLKDWKTH